MSDSLEVDVAPSFVHYEKPVYPELARLAMIEEVVWVEMIIDVHGFPKEVRAVKDSKNIAAFQESAESAGKKCTFSPALKDRKPTTAKVMVAFEFKVSSEDRRRDAIRRRLGG